MHVLHISTNDIAGGAARAAYRLHRGLLQTGVTSSMLVTDKRSNDQNVIVPNLSRRLDHRLRRFSRRKQISIVERRIAKSRLRGSEFYSTAQSAYTGFWEGAVGDASVLNLHWVAQFVDYPSFFAAIPPGKPLVWTLHDSNPLTGGCHYAGQCEKFMIHCGACPQLKSTRRRDTSWRTFDLKAQAYAHLGVEQVILVAPSTWIAREARRSALLSRFRIEHIPYGLDLDVFRPRDRDAAKTSFGIQENERVVLFVSDYVDNHRKGLDLFLSAIRTLETKDNLVLLSVGNGHVPKVDGVRSIHLGRIDSDLVLSLVYNIADVFVIPSREEQLGQTAIEATACGCPVVGFGVGGIPDVVEEGRTGFLAAPLDTRQLSDAIEIAISRRDQLSAACRARAERLFGLETQARAYTKLYSRLLETRSGESSAAFHEN